MTVDELVAEGERLPRPCFLLNVEGNGEVVGYWRGERMDHPITVPPEATALRSIEHFITMDAHLLERVEISEPSSSIGFAEVDLVDGGTGYRVYTSTERFSEIQCDGLPLYATEGRSFPPFEAVCLYVNEGVAAWLNGLGLERHDYEQPAAPPL